MTTLTTVLLSLIQGNMSRGNSLFFRKLPAGKMYAIEQKRFFWSERRENWAVTVKSALPELRVGQYARKPFGMHLLSSSPQTNQPSFEKKKKKKKKTIMSPIFFVLYDLFKSKYTKILMMEIQKRRILQLIVGIIFWQSPLVVMYVYYHRIIRNYEVFINVMGTVCVKKLLCLHVVMSTN